MVLPSCQTLAFDEAGIHAGSNHRLKNMAQDVAVAEAAMAINGERRVIGNLVVEIKPTEPAVGQMLVPVSRVDRPRPASRLD
jgi:hypothetical protein